MSNIKYTEEQKIFLKENAERYSLSCLTKLYNETFQTFKSNTAIKNTLDRYGFKQPKKVTINEEEQVKFFSENLNCTLDELTRRYNTRFASNLSSVTIRKRRNKAVSTIEVDEPTMSFSKYNGQLTEHLKELSSSSWGRLLSRSHKKKHAA